MTDSAPQKNRLFQWSSTTGWSFFALVIAAFVLLPILSILWLALTTQDNVWPHLITTTLPRYLTNSGVLMISVGLISAAVGTGAAWFVTQYRFPGVRWLEWALFLPLAVPAYLGAYALVDFLEYAGPVQKLLREVFGWQSARDYWFPEIRSRGAAILVLSASLYPYVYLLARAAFREQSAGGHDVARALGAGTWSRFRKVALPLARPAIAAGAAITMMETVSDFGTVDYFAVQTLTTGIFTVWLENGSAGGAAQIATLILVVVIFLSATERLSRQRQQVFAPSRNYRPTQRRQVKGAQGWTMTGLCLLPFFLGFVLPAGVLGHLALGTLDFWRASGLISALTNTVFVGSAAAAITIAMALFMVYGVRLSEKSVARSLLPMTTVGYAAPGAVLAVGLLLPMAAADHFFADQVLALTGYDPGLLMTGTSFALVFAYVIRFFAIAQGAADTGMERISPSLPMVARSLGQSASGTLRRVYFPLVRGSIGAAFLLVFVDCVKELPATLLLRPFGFNTLATLVYEQASLEKLSHAAPAALVIILVSLLPIIILARGQKG